MSTVASQIAQQPVATTPAATPEKISKTSQIITNIIFWLAFISFLSTSIPHVAWLYNVYEPQDQPIWWVMCYAVAISIDVMIAWLSFVQTMSKFKDGWLTWVFIGLLSALSWYANYLYDMKHNPIVQSDMWNIQIFFGWTTTGYITPIIISAIPFFSIAYTFMLSKVGDRKVETLAEMRARLADVKERKQIEQELKTVHKVSLKDRIIGGIDDAKEVIAAAKNETDQAQNSDVQPVVVSQVVSPQVVQNETVVSLPVSSEVVDDETHDEPTQETTPDEFVSLPVSPLPRITVKLNETTTKQERNTDKLRRVSQGSSVVSQKKPSGETEAIVKIRRAVSRNANIDPVKLAQKAGVTPQYAGRIKAKVLAEREEQR